MQVVTGLDRFKHADVLYIVYIYQAGIYIADRGYWPIRHNMQGLEAKGVFSYLSYYMCVEGRRR